MDTLLQYQNIVLKIVEVIDYIMFNELKIFPPEQYDLDQVGGRVALVASFNPMQMGKSLNIYESNDTLRRLTDALGGLPVVITRKMGLKYVIPLNGRPQLPKMVELPLETQHGRVALGVKHNGKSIVKPWSFIGHVMVVGKTRSGKSTALRLIAFQALRDNFLLAIADNDLTTFPMLNEHPALFAPIASDPQAACELIEKVNAECDSRAAQFKSMPGYPETMDEYNRLAVQQGREPLRPMLVILDELSNTIIRSGAKQKQLTNLLGALGMRTLKFGVQIIFAAHEFTKDQIGLIRPQCETVMAFRNEAKEMSALMGCHGAERIPQDRQGMVVTNKWGRLQAYYLDKERMGGGVPTAAVSALSEQEAALVKRSMAEAGGVLSIPLLVAWGLKERESRSLVENWEARGWVSKDAAQKNARVITSKLAEMVSNGQTGQTASSTHIWRQTASSYGQTPNMAGGALA